MSQPGAAWVFVTDTSGTSQGDPVQVVDFEIGRKINEIGKFTISVPASVPWAFTIKRGWRVSLVQDNNIPDNSSGSDYLLYKGEVIDHDFDINESGTAVLKISGGLRTFTLQGRSTHLWVFDNPPEDIISDLVDLDQIMGSPTSVTYPTFTGHTWFKTTFTDLSRYAALLRMADYLRCNIRDNWDFDGIEFLQWDNLSPSGYTFLNRKHIDPEHAEEQAELGYGIIAASPTFRVKGQDIVNSIKPIGVDTVGDETPDLTLESLSTVGPYTVQTDNVHGFDYWYIEDAVSVAQYGRLEFPFYRTDIRNPSDDSGTRAATRAALGAVAANELLRRRSEYIEFDIPIANGADIWALPGDAVKMEFEGAATVAAGIQFYISIDAYVLITSRRDTSGPGGTRNVSFTVAMPRLPIVNPNLPDAIILPPPPGDGPAPTDPAKDEPQPGEPPADPAGPEVPGGSVANCCPDTTTETNAGPDEPDPDTDVTGDPDNEGTPLLLSRERVYWSGSWSGNFISLADLSGMTSRDALVVIAERDNSAPTLTGNDVTIVEVGSMSCGRITGTTSFVKVWTVRRAGPSPSTTLTGTSRLVSMPQCSVPLTGITYNFLEDHQFLDSPGAGTYVMAWSHDPDAIDDTVYVMGYGRQGVINASADSYSFNGTLYGAGPGTAHSAIGPKLGSPLHDITVTFTQTVGVVDFFAFIVTATLICHG